MARINPLPQAGVLLLATALLLGLLVHVAELLPRPAGKRLDSIGVENTQENRRAYRTLLLSAPGASED